MTIAELKGKLEHFNRLTGLNYHISNIYQRTNYPYILATNDSQTIMRGTKEQIGLYLTGAIDGITKFATERNIKFDVKR